MNQSTLISVSVVVLTYKQSDVLDLIIQGLNLQTYAGEIEVIISDDGSPGSVAAKNICVANQSKHKVKYVWHPDVGFRVAAARNNGIRVAQNDLLIFLDGDIIPHSGLIEKHVSHHKQSKQLVAGNRTWVGEFLGTTNLNELADVKPDHPTIIRGERENLYRHELLRSSNPWRACFGANLSVMRSPLIYFDERFVGWGPEDAEFCYRLCMKHDFTPIYDESIGSFHLESPYAVGNVFRKNDHASIVNYIRNTFLFYDKCPGLGLTDVFLGFPKLKLNKDTNIWSVIPRSKIGNFNIEVAVKTARRWTESN